MRTAWIVVVGALVGCEEVDLGLGNQIGPDDCTADQRFVERSTECGPADELLEAGPACLDLCEQDDPEACPFGACGPDGVCIELCG